MTALRDEYAIPEGDYSYKPEEFASTQASDIYDEAQKEAKKIGLSDRQFKSFYEDKIQTLEQQKLAAESGRQRAIGILESEESYESLKHYVHDVLKIEMPVHSMSDKQIENYWQQRSSALDSNKTVVSTEHRYGVTYQDVVRAREDFQNTPSANIKAKDEAYKRWMNLSKKVGQPTSIDDGYVSVTFGDPTHPDGAL